VKHTFRPKSLLLFIVLLSVVFFSALDTRAQLDPTFGTNGVATANIGEGIITLGNFVLPDGKILIVNQSDCCPNAYKQYFVRFNPDGTRDSTYGTNGVLQISIPFSTTAGRIRRVARQPDGKIILVGLDDASKGIIARFNENGTLDASFAGGGVQRPDIEPFGSDQVTAVFVQTDGKILFAGDANTGAGRRFYMMRYLANGSPDTSFGVSSGIVIHSSISLGGNSAGEFLAVQSSGKIVVGNRYDDRRIRRFNSDGSIDNSFTVISLTTDYLLSTIVAALQPDDKILMAAAHNQTATLERGSRDSLILRYNADGSVDTSFGTAGQVSFDISNYQIDIPMELKVMPDGQIFVAVNTYITPNRSRFRSWTLALARLSSSGAVSGKLTVANADDHADDCYTSFLPDGKILTAYKTLGGDIMLVRASGVPLQNLIFHAIPYDFPVVGTGYAKPSVFRPGDNTFRIYPSLSYTFGLSDDVRVVADYIGNYSPEIAYFRPSEGNWYIGRDYQGAGTNPLVIRWGLSGDIPVPADYNGDGKDDIAVFRPSDGNWYIYYIENSSYAIYQWGLNGDKPAQGDYDGDGKTDIGVYRPSDGNWYIHRSSDGGYTILHFGLDGDIPVQEDYDGDGKFDIAVFRSTDGVWYRLNSSNGSFLAIRWGLAGDIPVPGDYDAYNGEMKTNVAVWRSSNGTWYILNSDNATMHSYVWGASGDIPLPAKF
jgi:uncharacterized delta-60 repeat protein